MAAFVEAIGRPDQAYPIIHLAGTNGKGSTAAMLERIFRAAGYKTGLFTSPHLVHLGERIQVNRNGVLGPEPLRNILLFDGYRRVFRLSKKRHSGELSMSQGENVNTMDAPLFKGPGTGI